MNLNVLNKVMNKAEKNFEKLLGFVEDLIEEYEEMKEDYDFVKIALDECQECQQKLEEQIDELQEELTKNSLTEEKILEELKTRFKTGSYAFRNEVILFAESIIFNDIKV